MTGCFFLGELVICLYEAMFVLLFTFLKSHVSFSMTSDHSGLMNGIFPSQSGSCGFTSRSVHASHVGDYCSFYVSKGKPTIESYSFKTAFNTVNLLQSIERDFTSMDVLSFCDRSCLLDIKL